MFYNKTRFQREAKSHVTVALKVNATSKKRVQEISLPLFYFIKREK